VFLSNEEKRKLVLNGNLYKGLLILSLPIIFNNFMQTLYNLVDTYWVGKISSTDIEVGAVGGVFPVTHMIIAFGMGLYVTATSLMSQNIGADNKKRANYIASQSFAFAILLGVVLMVIGLFLNPYIVRAMGFEGQTYELGTQYLGILFLEIPIMFGLLIFTSMRQSYGDTLTPVIFTVSSVILNVILDPIFIVDQIHLFNFDINLLGQQITSQGFTLQGLNLGVKGAALATVLSKAVIMPFWLSMAFFDRRGLHLNLKDMVLDPKTIKKIVRIAIPASFGQAINAAGFVVLQVFVYGYGVPTQSAFNITNRINSLAMMPAMGVGSALSFYIGQNIGNQNFERAKKAFRACMQLTLLFGFVGMSFMLIDASRQFMVGLFLNEDETIALSLFFLTYVAFNTPLMGIFQSLMGVFQGSGKTMYGFILTVSRLWAIRIPMIWFFQTFTHVGSITLYISMISSNVLVIIIGFVLYFKGSWQKRIIEEEESVSEELTELKEKMVQ
jgi:putative MATE family efflux protein